LTKEQEVDSSKIRADAAEKKYSEISKSFFMMEDRAKELCQKLESLEKELIFYKSQQNTDVKLRKASELEQTTIANQRESGI